MADATKKAKPGMKKDGTPARLGVRGKSTTGEVINVKADQTNWRKKMQQARIKLDDEAKLIYVDKLAETGLKWVSSNAAGVAESTVTTHRKNDPEFDAAVIESLNSYRDKVVDHARTLIFEGEVTKRFKNGECIEEKHTYPIRLIELELKRQEAEYRDKQTIDLNSQGGGVLIAPADKTPQEWIDEQRAANEEKLKKLEADKK